MAALAKQRLAPWPWPGAVGLVEKDNWSGRTDIHVVHGWRWLGTAKTEQEVWELLAQGTPRGLDAEEYPLLKKAIQSGKLEVRHLARLQS